MNKVDKKLPDVSGLVKKTDFNAKITEVEGKIHSITSFSYLVFETKFVVSILTLLTNLSYSVFSKISFKKTLLSFAKSLGTGVNLSISNLSTSVFKLAKFDFNGKCDTFLNQFLLHN